MVGFLAAGFAAVFFAAGFLAGVILAAALAPFGSGTVFVEAEAGSRSGGAEAACLAASCQFGKNNSMRWREIEFARRQRGQCAS